MPKYKNVSERAVKFRAAKTANKPTEKKIYEIEPGKTLEVPVQLIHGQELELVESGEMTIKKTKKKKGD